MSKIFSTVNTKSGPHGAICMILFFCAIVQCNNGPYSSFRLKMRFWGQNDKDLNTFGVTTDMLFVI